MHRARRETLIVAAVLVVVPAVGVVGLLKYQDWQRLQDRPKPVLSIGPDHPPSPETFHIGRAVAEQSPITDVAITSAMKAGARVADDEIVLGVVVDGDARAYPINSMTGPQREIFNDTLANRPIAATW